MTLKNLLGLSLDGVAPDKAHTAKLLAAAERNIADAKLQGLSTENRFDAAYKAIMQLAMVALNANGYRTMTSKPGHHQTGSGTARHFGRTAACASATFSRARHGCQGATDESARGA